MSWTLLSPLLDQFYSVKTKPHKNRTTTKKYIYTHTHQNVKVIISREIMDYPCFLLNKFLKEVNTGLFFGSKPGLIPLS